MILLRKSKCTFFASSKVTTSNEYPAGAYGISPTTDTATCPSGFTPGSWIHEGIYEDLSLMLVLDLMNKFHRHIEFCPYH